MDTYDAENPPQPIEFFTARDDDGHGTHILSTAAGNGGAEAAVVFGEPLAVISGVAPRAHAVAYKVFSPIDPLQTFLRVISPASKVAKRPLITPVTT